MNRRAKRRAEAEHKIDVAGPAPFGLAVVGMAIFAVGASLFPGLRLSDLAHESGHAAVASAGGYDVVGIVLDPRGSASTYTSFDPWDAHGVRDHVMGSMILTSGIGGAAVLAGGLLLAVSLMRTGRRIVLGAAAGLLAVAVYLVPESAELRSRGLGATSAAEFTWAYVMVVVVLLLVTALLGGRVSRVSAYVLVVVACVGLVGDLRELWLPSQYPTDAHLAEAVTGGPIELWRVVWTLGALLLVAGPLVRLVRSANGWPLQRYLFDVRPPAAEPSGDPDRLDVTV